MNKLVCCLFLSLTLAGCVSFDNSALSDAIEKRVESERNGETRLSRMEHQAGKQFSDTLMKQKDSFPNEDETFARAVIFRYPLSQDFFSLVHLTEQFKYHFYLIVTDKLSNPETVHSAFKAYMCNFSSESESTLLGIDDLALIPFITPTFNDIEINDINDLIDGYNLPMAKIIHSYLAEEFNKENILIVGTREAIRIDTLINLEQNSVVLGLSNMSSAEVTRTISFLNNAVIRSTDIEQIEKVVGDTKETYTARLFKQWFRRIGNTVLPIKNAYASTTNCIN